MTLDGTRAARVLWLECKHRMTALICRRAAGDLSREALLRLLGRQLGLLSDPMEWPWRVKLKQAELHTQRYAEVAATYLDGENVHLEYPKDTDAGTIDVVLRADSPPPGLLGAIDSRECGIWDRARIDRSQHLHQARDEARRCWRTRWSEVFE